jgi:AraC-like DNA-binding protein
MGVSIAVVRLLAGALEQEGVNTATWLAEAGVPAEALVDLRNELSETHYERLVAGAFAATGDPALGLSIGGRAPVSALSLLGPLMMSCATLREAVEALLRHDRLLGHGASWSLHDDGAHARLTFQFALASPFVARFSAECAAALVWKVTRHFDRALHPLELRFAHSEPAYAPRYAELFGCRVRFGAPHNALVYAQSALDTRNAFADAQLCSSLEAIAERMSLTQNPSNTAERVRDLLRYRVDLDGFDARQIARGVGLSESALRRRLAAAGSNVTLLIEEARARAACEALRRPDCNIKELAESLGYSQSSAFHRAFKRWTGLTPRDYARSHDPARARGPAPRAARAPGGSAALDAHAR